MQARQSVNSGHSERITFRGTAHPVSRMNQGFFSLRAKFVAWCVAIQTAVVASDEAGRHASKEIVTEKSFYEAANACLLPTGRKASVITVKKGA